MSIKIKLILLLLIIGLVPTFTVGVVSYVTISRELKSNTDNQIQSTAIKQEQKISALLQARQEQVSQLSNQYDLQVALAQYLHDKSSASREAIDEVIQTKKNGVSDIQAISISDLNGTVIASTLDGNEGTTDASAKNFVNSGNSTDSLIKQDSMDNLDKLNSYSMLTVNKQNTAALTVVFRIDDITAAVQDYTGLGSTGETVVGVKNTSGHVISQFPLRFDTESALRTNLDSLKMDQHVDSLAYSKVKDYRGKTVIMAAGSVGFANWYVGAKIDADEALAPIKQLQNALLAIAVVSPLVITVVALYSARFFTNPILRIASTAKRIGQGDFSARSEVRRSDEIGTLANSVNAMGTSLQDFVRHIESQRTRLEIILNSTEEGILSIDTTGVITTANRAAAELVSLPAENLVDQNINDIFKWTRNGAPVAISYAALATTYTDLQFSSPDGVVHFVTVNVSHVKNNLQQPSQIILTIHDETKSRELENMKIDFVSMAAHELRTPLAAIRGYLELISFKEKSTVSPDTQKYLNQASKSTVELGSLINNLLDVTRIERGTLTMNLTKVDLASNVTQAVRDLRFAASDKNITLTYDGPASGYLVEGDPIAIHEVINNLITNAIKYTNEGGRVSVVAAQYGDTYQVTIKDNGIGIPKAAIPNLFTKFYRVRGGLNSGSTGTGLGLFISKSIIERLNGTINVDSREGVGSTFSFTLPKLNEKTAAQLSEEAKDANKTRRQRGWVTKNIAR